MIITELYIKNFGKFSEQRISFHDGVQVIYGENEFGKTTIHAFIRAMLFGMERGRGKAAAKDSYSRYEPWDNPNVYEGMMRFACGGRNFRLERSFDRFTRHAYLICENDGEELSVEQGDLDMLLGGLTPALYDSTVSIGQLMIRPGQELADALRNYAVNDFEFGGEIDLNQALAMIDKKRKETDRARKTEERVLEEGRKGLEQECSYLEREMGVLQEEYAEKQSQKERLEKKRQINRGNGDDSRRESGAGESRDRRDENVSRAEKAHGAASRKLFRCGAGLLLAALVTMIDDIFAGGGFWKSTWTRFSVLSVICLAIGVVCILAGIVQKVAERRSAGHGGREEDVDGIHLADQGQGADHEPDISAGDAGMDAETAERIRQLEWEMERIQREYKEKEIRCGNLREELDERPWEESLSVFQSRIQALELAREGLMEASKQGNKKATDRVGHRASEIFRELTEGRYRQIDIGSRLELSVWDGHRRIPAYRLSRGTLEQIYFSLRMASADVMQEEIMPVILDDTFVFYDENRLKSVLKWLSRQERQVIILSCNKREMDLLREEYDT